MKKQTAKLLKMQNILQFTLINRTFLNQQFGYVIIFKGKHLQNLRHTRCKLDSFLQFRISISKQPVAFLWIPCYSFSYISKYPSQCIKKYILCIKKHQIQWTQRKQWNLCFIHTFCDSNLWVFCVRGSDTFCECY